MELSEELEAVNKTLAKWNNIKTLRTDFIGQVYSHCGFCDIYQCVSKKSKNHPDPCPAYNVCTANSRFWEPIDTEMYRRIENNINWLKKRREKLSREIAKDRIIPGGGASG